MEKFVKSLKVGKYIFASVCGFGFGLGLAIHWALFAFVLVGVVGMVEMTQLIKLYEEV